MMDFFIFSLPDSGSSWLSVFLTGRDSYCYHEPTADYSIEELNEHVSQRKEKTVGAIDTGAYKYPQKIIAKRYFSLLRYETEELPKHEPIHHCFLSDISYLRDIWQEIIGEGFDEERTRVLMEMNIRRDPNMFFSNRPDAIQRMKRLLA